MRGASRPPVRILRSVVAARPAETLGADGPWRLYPRAGRTGNQPELRLVTMQAVEQARAALTAYREAPGLEEAARVFDEVLTRAEQLAVAEEVVLTRAVELARAYPNTVAISFGPRRRVGAKWPPSARRVPPKGTIPRRLLAMATLGGRRMLCAVPTDVEDARFSRL